MATKERYQNPVPDDKVILRLFIYNQNSFSNVQSIEKVELLNFVSNNYHKL